MRVSLNEIGRMTQTAAAGTGVPTGLDADVATAAAWLSARALPALELLIHDLQTWRDRAGEFGLAVSGGCEAIDAEGRPASILGAIIVDLALARASAAPEGANIVLGDLCTPLFLLPHAARRSSLGYVFEIIWHEAATPPRAVQAVVRGAQLSIEATARSRAEICRAGVRYRTMLFCARDGADACSATLGGPVGVRYDGDDLREAERRALAEGVAVDPDLWRQLRDFAARTLVPASEASRARGAGPSNSDED